MTVDVASQFLVQLVDTANDIMNRFLYILMLLLMTISLFLGNFYFDD